MSSLTAPPQPHGVPARPAPDAGRPEPRPVPAGRAPAVAAGTVAVTALAALGVALRLWFLAHDPIEADQAVVGLMAQAILHGHPMVFYWGQAYGGVEPYVTAGLVGVFGLHPWVVNATPAVLAAVACVVAWRLVRAVGGSSAAGAVAGALVWVWSETDLWSSTREYGFRGVVLVCSLLLLLAVARLLADDRRAGSWVLLGAAAGIGWWASPEILYTALPALATVAWVTVRAVRGRGTAALLPVAAGAAALAVSLAPWLVASVHDRFASIREATAGQGPGTMGYLGRLHVFFVHTLPMVLGARLPVTGAWLGGRSVGAAVLVVTVAVLAVGAAAAAWHLPAARPAVAAVLAYPFVEAAMGPTSYWRDGRYGIYLPAIAVVAAVAGWDRWLRGRPVRAAAGRARGDGQAAGPAAAPAVAAVGPGSAGPRSAGPRSAGTWSAPPLLRAGLAVVACAAAAASTVAGMVAATAVPGTTAATGLAAHPAVLVGHPDGTARSVAADLVARHVTRAYADYWVAYDLDLFTGGRLVVTPAGFVRAAGPEAAVARARRPAWLFAGPSVADLLAYEHQFQNPEPGPMGLDLARFEAALHAAGIGYRVVPVGAVDAVVPGIRVTPQWVAAHLRPGG